MTLEIKVGPPQLAIHQGNTVLITAPGGEIPWPTAMGLYFFDTRMISAWAVYANGVEWDLLSSGTPSYCTACIYLTNRTMPSEGGDIAAKTLSLVIKRCIDGGLREDFELSNYGAKPACFNLEVVMRSDFADIFEVKSEHIVRRGRITSEWTDQEQRLTNSYKNADFHRSVAVNCSGDAGAVYANGRISYEIEVAAGATWKACLQYDLSDGTNTYVHPPQQKQPDPDRHVTAWRDAVLKLDSSNNLFQRIYSQAVDDMAALRLPTPAMDHMEFVPVAGLPWFVALFGRDSLIVSLQNTIVYPGFARGALDELAKWQATEQDDYRDAEPGKILHELRRGELAHFKLIPHTPYYGTADATPLFLITLHAAWRCTGDLDMVRRLLPVAERCLDWVEHWGDRDGDGFQEYQTRSTAGYENMAWKDAGDSVMHADGSPVKGPKALCELQGYVYDGYRRMAELYDALDRGDSAAALRAKAAKLYEAFNQAFWNEEAGFYYYGLDGDKQPIRSIASNPGHLLWSGIVPQDRAARMVQRFMQPDMWSGWGIRTLSAAHPSFNPYSYQNGSVWPHDNGIIALGFKRYGFAAEASRIAEDVLRAASFFMLNQLPELYAGIQRDDDNFPVQYLGANVPQAWAAGSVFSMVQAILGLKIDAPAGHILVDPTLPDWLPDVTLRDLRMGEELFDIRFSRDGEATEFEVLRGPPDLVRRGRGTVGVG